MGRQLLGQVIDITERYLGPAAERFVHRLIIFHLEKDPEQLNKQDLVKLAEWIKVSLGLLTNDKQLIDDCEKSILRLST